jgi:hypothetical protein
VRRAGDRRQGRLSAHDFVLDPALRVLAVCTIADPTAHAQQLATYVSSLPPLGNWHSALPAAPVLLVPQVVEPEFCRELITLYQARGGKDSGYMTTDESGKTVGVIDYGHKRRRDYWIEEEDVRMRNRDRIERHLVPQLREAFQFRAS